MSAEQVMAARLRSAWLGRRAVRVDLSERCEVQRIVGRVNHVSVTGAVATIDGWHVPVAEVTAIDAPTHEDTEAYADFMHHLREAASCSFCHGMPVSDAQTWLDDIERPPAACPRCGRVATGETTAARP
jgi:hypothetical protein